MNLKNVVKRGFLNMGALLYKNHDSKVIYYHDVHSRTAYTSMSTPINLFQQHMDIIEKEGYRVVKEIGQHEKEIEITFDDGFRGLYENFSWFVERKIPVKLFIVTDYIGKTDYLRAKEIQEMMDTGLLSIGSHGCSHRNLDTLDIKTLISELNDSKSRLENLFGNAVSSICFPRGRFSDLVLEESCKAGYTQLYSSLPGPYHKQFRHNLIHRSLAQHASPSEFSAILKGGDRIHFSRYLKMHYHPGEAV